ncbi:NAD(P)-binding domain-containing protein [Streptomyces diacarni]|uniref:NAD(P)-dependent oxidoreductase n=1 Tax=Streptomyces diacarni TaxID=2800381 RepID=UPI0033C95175
MSATVTVLGLGPMGTTLAHAFLDRGHRTTVWNRTPGRAEALTAKGATEACTAAEAVAASPLTVLCLAGHDAVRAVLDRAAEAAGGRTLVNLTSGSPMDARETAAWADRHGSAYLDGVLMTTTSGLGRPEALQLYAGSHATFDAVRHPLSALGTPLHLGTEPALPSVYDTALLSMLWGALTGWLHGAALIGADGPGGNVAATAFTDVAGQWLPTVHAFLRTYAGQVDSGSYPGGDFTLRLHQRTLGILQHADALRGVTSGLPELVGRLTDRAIAEGHGEDSFARLIEFLRERGAA